MNAPNVRSVTVRLNAEVAKYIADMKLAGKVTDDAFAKVHSRMGLVDRDAKSAQKSVQGLARSSGVLDKRLSSAADSMRKLSTQSRLAAPGLQSVDRQTVNLGSSLNRTGNVMDRTSGRLRLILEGVAALGSGLIPLGATAVLGIGGLASLFGGATIGALGLAAATQGVGDALKAVQKARLEPTVENIEAAETAMNRIVPEAREWVERVQEVLPVLRQIRDAGAAELFPGLTASIDDFERLEPVLTRFMSGVGEAGGDMIADATESLASERWRPFLEFLAVEAPEAIRDVSTLVGDLAHGAGSLWMAFDPANDGVIDWALDMADAFDRWSTSDEGREDIRAFIEYAQENGPAVGDFFASTINLLTQFVQAAAPLGGPTLKILTAVADAMASLADSDIATPLIAGVAAYAALNRVLLVTAGLQSKLVGTSAAAGAAGAAGVAGRGGLVGMFRSGTASARGFTGALSKVYSGTERARLSASQYAAAEQRRQAVVRQGLAGIGKTAGLVGGLAVLTTGLGDSMGVTNTASLGLMGTLAGPWGAALGAAVGLALDLAAANDDVTDSMEALTQLVDSGAPISELKAGLSTASADLKSFADDVEEYGGVTFGNALGLGDLTELKNSIEGLFGDSDADEARAEYEAAAAAIANTEAAARGLADALGTDIVGTQEQQLAALEALMVRMKPAMDELGISGEDLAAAYSEQRVGASEWAEGLRGLGIEMDPTAYDDMTRAIEKQASQMDSAEGRTDAYAEALNYVSDESLTAAQSAQLLSDAMNALLDPSLNAEAATDAWRESLQNLQKELKSGAGFEGAKQAAQDNRALTRDYVGDVQRRITALTEAGASEEKLARVVRESRREFIESGIAAGFSRKEIIKRANALGLTPKLIKTTLETAGFTEAQIQAFKAREAFRSLPKKLRTEIRADGIPQTIGEVNKLVEKYKLTEQERKALITLTDNASGPIQNVIRLLNDANGKRANTYTTHHITTINEQRTHILGPERKADGGLIRGPGGPREDAIPAYLSNGEYVIKAAAVDRYGVGMFDRLNALRFAGGGPVGNQNQQLLTRANGGVDDELRRTAKGLKALRHQVSESEKAVERERKERDEFVDKMRTLSTDVRTGLTTELGGENDPWTSQFGAGTLDADLATIQGDTRRGRRFTRLLKELEEKGFDGAALEALAAEGDVDRLAEYASRSRRKLREVEKAFNERARVLRRAGNEAADIRFGDQLKEANKELRESKGELKEANRRLERLEDTVKNEHAEDRQNTKRGSGNAARSTARGGR